MDSPFSNGLTERLNQALVNKIRCKINEEGNRQACTTMAQECVKIYNETEQTALNNSIKLHAYNKKIFDKHRQYHEFNVGDAVFVENGNRLNRNKLDKLRVEPFKIIENLSDSIYRINV